MFKIEDGRTLFWQWDLNQRIVVGENLCSEVHFSNGLTGLDNGQRLISDANVGAVQ